MIFALGFYIIGFVLCLFKPFWGLMAMIMSVLIRFQDRMPSVVAIQPFTLLFLGLVIGFYLNRSKLSQQKWAQDKLLVFMFFLSVFSLVMLARGELIHESWLYINAIGFYFFASRLIQTPKQFIITFLVISGCVAFMASEAINSVMILGEVSPHIDSRNGRWQGLGYYANPNEFGQLMIVCIPLLYAIIRMRINLLLSILSIAMIALMLYIVAKTNSRTVMVVFGMMVVMTFVLHSSGKLAKKIVVAGIVTVMLVTVISFVPGSVQDRLSSIQNAGQDASFQGRTRSWGYGFDMVTWYPFTGVGKGQWSEYHGLMPHNSYIQIMAENGPLVLVLFLWVIISTLLDFRPFFKSINKKPPKILVPEETFSFRIAKVQQESVIANKETKTIAIGVLVMLLGWLLYIFFGNQAYSIWTYFYIGLAAACRNLLFKDAETKSEPDENMQTN